MPTRASSSHVSAPNIHADVVSDEALVRGFLLSCGASGRKQRTLATYEESLRKLSDFASGLGLAGLAGMDRQVVRHWLTSLYQNGNKPATVSVRYRAARRFFGWCVKEGERENNPMDLIDPPKIPDEIQPFYSINDVDAVLKTIGRGRTLHEFRDKAIILTLYDTGVRASELVGMMADDINWKELSVLVTGKAGKQRRVSIGHKCAEAIERYVRKRGVTSTYLWLASGNRAFSTNGLRMMLERRFKDAGVEFRGAHAFRRGFAMSYLESGGALDDLKELGGWGHYAMVSRYARASAADRAVKAHKRFSPADRLDSR